MVEKEIGIGSICRVNDSECVYTSLTNWAFDNGSPYFNSKRYITSFNYKIVQNRIVRVLNFGRNKMHPNGLSAIVETIDNKEYLTFMILLNGLKLIEADVDCSLFETENKREINASIVKSLVNKSLNRNVPDYCADEYFIGRILYRNPLDLQFVNPNLISDEHYKKALYKDGGLLGLIPENRRTLELCKIALENEEYAERFIPEALRSLVANIK